MRNKRFLILAFVLFASFPAAAAQVREARAKSGVAAWLAEERSQPLIAVRAVFRNAGFAQDPPGKEGRAQLAAELLLEGAGGRDALAFNRLLEEKAIRISAQVDEDFFIITLQTLSEHRDLAFSLLGDMVARPRFDAEAVARVKARARTALRQLEQDPSYLLERGLAEAAYGKHPYGRPQRGTPASIARLAPADFTALARRYFTRENLFIGVAGDIAPDALAAQLDAQFAPLPARFAPPRALPEAVAPAAGERRIALSIPQTLIAFATPGVKRTDPDYLVAHVANHLIGGGVLTSRLGKEIREKRGLAYGVYTALAPNLHGALLVGDFSIRNEQAGAALGVLRETLQSLHAEGVTEAELEDAKRYLTGSFVMGLDTNAELAGMLVTMQVYGLGRDYLERRNRLVEAVTREQVNAMMKKLLDMRRLTVTLVGEPEGAKNASP